MRVVSSTEFSIKNRYLSLEYADCEIDEDSYKQWLNSKNKPCKITMARVNEETKISTHVLICYDPPLYTANAKYFDYESMRPAITVFKGKSQFEDALRELGNSVSDVRVYSDTSSDLLTLRAEIERLRGENTQLNEQDKHLEEENTHLKEENTHLKEEVAQLHNAQLKNELTGISAIRRLSIIAGMWLTSEDAEELLGRDIFWTSFQKNVDDLSIHETKMQPWEKEVLGRLRSCNGKALIWVHCCRRNSNYIHLRKGVDYVLRNDLTPTESMRACVIMDITANTPMRVVTLPKMEGRVVIIARYLPNEFVTDQRVEIIHAVTGQWARNTAYKISDFPSLDLVTRDEAINDEASDNESSSNISSE